MCSWLIYVFSSQIVGANEKLEMVRQAENSQGNGSSATQATTNLGNKTAAGFCANTSKADVAGPIIETSSWWLDMSGVLGIEPDVLEPEKDSGASVDSLVFNCRSIGELTGEFIDTGRR